MTDYKEDQANELEALESIYPEEIKVIETEPYAVFEISLVSQKDENKFEEEEDDGAACTLQFTYTEKYPDEAPLVEIVSTENLDEDQENEIMDLIHTQVEENLGMVMVFTLVSAVQEQLTTMVEDSKQKVIEEENRRKKEEEELEMKKFEGTKCTIENFLAWKTKFDAEMAELEKRSVDSNSNKDKLTGKELFMQDTSMMESDVQFLQAEGEQVEVDESLFQDMDDIDLGAEGLDDLED